MRKRRELPGINAASMADIAFLLLIFFILITKIDNSVGISRNLPPINEEQQQSIIDINRRNVFEITLKDDNQLFVNNNVLQLNNLKIALKQFILNNGRNPDMSDSPKDVVILLKIERESNYNTYIAVQNEITHSYNEIRNESANLLYRKNFQELNYEQQTEIRKLFPMQLSEADFVNEKQFK